jgi:hypothetical protein
MFLSVLRRSQSAHWTRTHLINLHKLCETLVVFPYMKTSSTWNIKLLLFQEDSWTLIKKFLSFRVRTWESTGEKNMLQLWLIFFPQERKSNLMLIHLPNQVQKLTWLATQLCHSQSTHTSAVWEGSRVEHWHCHKTNYIFHLPQQEHTRHHLSTMPPIIIIIIIVITYQLQTKKIKKLSFQIQI